MNNQLSVLNADDFDGQRHLAGDSNMPLMGRVSIERPIFFKPDMVRATLEGRKTQTRRLVTGVGNDNRMRIDRHRVTHVMDAVKHGLCPYGMPGDRLWVRETTIRVEDHGYEGPVYLASENGQAILDHGLGPGPDEPAEVEPYDIKCRPSIHMPRSMARLFLEITNIRVERLQDITEEDAIAEGAQHFPDLPGTHPYGQDARYSMEQPVSTEQCLGSARMAFANYFCKLSGKPHDGVIDVTPWESNPWVWVIEFNLLRPNE